MYNETMLQNTNNVLGLFEYANHVTGDLFMNLLVISMYFIMILALKRYDFVQSIWVSSFVMFLTSSFLAMTGLVTVFMPIFFIAIVAFIALRTYTADA